jgi:hypothetical protein
MRENHRNAYVVPGAAGARKKRGSKFGRAIALTVDEDDDGTVSSGLNGSKLDCSLDPVVLEEAAPRLTYRASYRKFGIHLGDQSAKQYWNRLVFAVTFYDRDDPEGHQAVTKPSNNTDSISEASGTFEDSGRR